VNIYNPPHPGKGLQRDSDGILVWKGGGDYRQPDEAIKTWWAGNLRFGCNERCFSNYHSHPCGNTAKHDPDAKGNPTKCGTHSQAAKDKRKAKSDARHEATREQWAREKALNKATAALEPALRKIAEGYNDARGLAEEVIAELDGARGN
jgi:hypothetical protein